ncbi:sulfotransferase family 2 domain-containing protein [Paracoccus sp. ME4]|uniref:sulfotransferase family 2 domain-containing protein n=1 Tax=Paracoccus sp. ME4 TaxID=3138066 RepID=UPI00398BACCA
MIIFWRKSLVMLSVPKTGTHSYIDHLQYHADIVIKHPQNLKHMGIKQFNKKILPLFPNQETDIDYFGYIRNPADWLWSWYRYRSRPEINNRPSSTAGISFRQFIDDYLDPNTPPHANVGRQSSILTSSNPNISANIIFKYENRDTANSYLSQRLGIAVNPDKFLNRSPVMNSCISKEEVAILERSIPFEFELYESAV